MRVATALVGVLLLLSVTGCSIFGLQNTLYSDYGVGELKVDQNSASVKLQKAITKSGSEGLVDPNCFTALADPMKAASCKHQRNTAIAVLLNASDDMCQVHLKTIFGNEASFNIISGTIYNLATGLATGISGLTAKTALSAVALFASAERSLVNETIYKNLLVTAVTTKIREARDAKAAPMLAENWAKDTDSYPMLRVMRDVIDYHYTCSFMFGLEKALKEGTQPAVDSKKMKLEQEIQLLELQLIHRTSILKDLGMSATAIENDITIKSLKDRISAKDTELKNLAIDLTALTAGTQNLVDEFLKNVDGDLSALTTGLQRTRDTQKQAEKTDTELGQKIKELAAKKEPKKAGELQTIQRNLKNASDSANQRVASTEAVKPQLLAGTKDKELSLRRTNDKQRIAVLLAELAAIQEKAKGLTNDLIKERENLEKELKAAREAMGKL